MKELSLSEATLVTREESEKIMQKNGNIEIIPVWKFLLDEWFR
jgi:predicted AAA+ superfamily ATPase